MRCVVQYPAAAQPYAGEVTVPVHEAGVGVPDWQPGPVEPDPEPDGLVNPVTDPEPDPERSCTELTRAGEPCKGRPGPDNRCAAHKDT
jgi:hypothetical protein